MSDATNTEDVVMEMKNKLLDATSNKEDISSDNQEIAVTILKQLIATPMTLDLLNTTKIGRVVNKLRKCKVDAINSISKNLIKKWKAKMIKSKMGLAGTKREMPDSQSNNDLEKQTKKARVMDSKAITMNNGNNNEILSKDKIPTKDEIPTEDDIKDEDESAYTQIEYHLGETSDKFRDKIQKLIYKRLGGTPDQEKRRIEIAIRVEQALCDRNNGDCGNDYRSKLRSLNYNLKDPKNPDLNAALYSGALLPEKFVNSTEEELASDTLKKLRKDNWKWMKEAAQCDWNRHHINEKMITDMFRCGKCGKRRTTWFQKQTRCADEPMTTFVRCLFCDNRWRQS